MDVRRNILSGIVCLVLCLCCLLMALLTDLNPDPLRVRRTEHISERAEISRTDEN